MQHDVTFNFGSTKVCSPAIFETCFSYEKDIWIAATGYYMYFYIIFSISIDISRREIIICTMCVRTCVRGSHSFL